MGDISEEIRIEKLGPLRVAAYRAISPNPKGEALDHLKLWMVRNGIWKPETRRTFGFDVPLAREQLDGYEIWMAIDEALMESEGVRIREICCDEYAVLRVYGPLSKDRVLEGWKTLHDWVINSEYAPLRRKDRYWLESPGEDERGEYLDLYYPVR